MNTTRWDNDTVRQLERSSIRSFMEEYGAPNLPGRVLDFGAGKQPYKDLVDGEYVPFDKAYVPDGVLFDKPFNAVMCNQVMQYLENPQATLYWFHSVLVSAGFLVLTYPTNWDEVETSDLWRFTKQGMHRMVTRAGFNVMVHKRRAEIDLNGFKFPLGYGVVAQKC